MRESKLEKRLWVAHWLAYYVDMYRGIMKAKYKTTSWSEFIKTKLWADIEIKISDNAKKRFKDKWLNT